jgi:N6-L-threonylcarbamoyladenine synthase
MLVLGIETSCDETAAAVVALADAKAGGKLLSNTVASSMDLHAQYGGVVPEIAARSHIESIIPVIQEALDEAFPALAAPLDDTSDAALSHRQQQWSKIDAIAVTYGAGLGGSLLIGVLSARTLAIVYNKPLYAINHVEGHLYANFITSVADTPALSSYQVPASPPRFPVLGLIVSGGHSQLVLFRDHFDYTLLGQTNDDAIGEAFDKVAKILGLPYPGGPSVSKKALEGNPQAFKLPKAKMPGKYDFSFSGLKTAVLRLAQQQIGEDFTFPSTGLAARLSEQQKADIAASFQHVAIETVVDKTILAYKEFGPQSVIIGGGVASSPELRRQLAERLGAINAPLPVYTDPKLCTDNAAMVASLGCYHYFLGSPTADPFTLDISPNLSM